MSSPSEDLRVLAIRLYPELHRAEQQAFAHRLIDRAGEETPRVKLALASTAQKLPEDVRLKILTSLTISGIDPEDHNLPLMIWYGLEPLVVEHPEFALKIAEQTNLPRIQQFIARRLTSELADSPELTTQLVKLFPRVDSARQRQFLIGMNSALRGWRKADPRRIGRWSPENFHSRTMMKS